MTTHCVDCELNKYCPAIMLGSNGSGYSEDCALYIERKVGKRLTLKQLRKEVQQCQR